jgi:hypothetical protein
MRGRPFDLKLSLHGDKNLEGTGAVENVYKRSYVKM